MKKIAVLYRILALILAFSMVTVAVLAAEVESTDTTVATEAVTSSLSQDTADLTSGCFSLDASIAMHGTEEITDNAEAIFLYELNSRTLIYALNPDTPLDPSSFTKLMTALIAVEEGKLEDVVMVKQSVLDTVPWDAVLADLQDGEVMTLEDLLYCMLVGSANDAAAVIADCIAGSQEAFVARMNQRAVELGCSGTNLVNVHGIPEEGQRMTARDVAKVLAAATSNESFLQIFTTAEYSVPATNKSAARSLHTNNHLCSTAEMEIYYDRRVKGGRTGVAGDGTRGVAVIAEEGDLRFISVVMGAKSVVEDGSSAVRTFGGFNETRILLDVGFNGYQSVQILFDGQALTSWNVAGGENVVVGGPKTVVASSLPANIKMENLDFRYNISDSQLKAPISAGDRLCNLEIWYGNMCIAETDIFAMNDVREVGHLQLQESRESSFGSILLWTLVIVCILVVLAVIALRICKMLNIKLFRGRRKKRRRG